MPANNAPHGQTAPSNRLSVVIVGAGHAGGRAAETLRSAEHRGPITVIGSEKYRPYERPPLSKELLGGRLDVDKTFLRPAGFYEDARIDLALGVTAVKIDRASQRLDLSDGRSIAYDRLILTTGARPRRLTIPCEAADRIFYLRDLADSLALASQLKPGIRLAIIGAGFIGLEVAATARRMGALVTVIEYFRHPLARVAPQEIGQYLMRLHQRQGVIVHTSVRISQIDDGGQSAIIRVEGGGAIEADLIVVGIGAMPNVELAQTAGLSVNDGVLVNEFGETSDPAIFAAGDVTRHFNPVMKRALRLESWQNAQNQSVAVAKIVAGGHEPFAEVPWFWTDQFDVNLQMAGIHDDCDQLVWRGTCDEPSFTLFHLAHGKLVAATTVNNAREMRFARTLIARGQPVDVTKLADKAINLQTLLQ